MWIYLFVHLHAIFWLHLQCTCTAQFFSLHQPRSLPSSHLVKFFMEYFWHWDQSDCVIKSLTCIILKLYETINTSNHVFCFCFLHSIRVNLWIHNQMSYLRRTQRRNIWIAITELDSSLFTNRTSIIEAVINLPTYIYPSLVPKGLQLLLILVNMNGTKLYRAQVLITQFAS